MIWLGLAGLWWAGDLLGLADASGLLVLLFVGAGFGDLSGC